MTRCARCGRVLRDPASIAAGLGPECRGKTPTRKQRRAEGFAHGQVTIGERTYTRDELGNWSDGVKVIPYFEDWLVRYGLISV